MCNFLYLVLEKLYRLGNPVRKYVLDHAIYGIDVDEDTGTILATDVNSNDPILSFKI